MHVRPRIVHRSAAALAAAALGATLLGPAAASGEPATAALASAAVAQKRATSTKIVDDPAFGPDRETQVAQDVAADQFASTAAASVEVLARLAKHAGPEAALPDAGYLATARRYLADLAGRAARTGNAFLEQERSSVVERMYRFIGPEDPFRATAKLSADDLEPGDILVSSTPAQVSQFIRIATWGQYSHALVYAGHGKVIDATKDGVQERTLAELRKEADRVGVIRVAKLSKEKAHLVVAKARALIGGEYNYRGLLGMAVDRVLCFTGVTGYDADDALGCMQRVATIPKVLMAKGMYFCSELVNVALERAGVDLFRRNGPSPADFVRLAVAKTSPARIVGRLI